LVEKLGVLKMRDLPPVHPSEILTEDFMLPLQLTPDQLAQNIHISLSQLEELKFPSFSGARNLENEKNSEKNFENFCHS
jgi:hypothetical protein